MREGTYILVWDEITIFSTGGFGITGEIDIGPLTLTPIFLYSKNYDSLFFEYPRLFYGGKIDFFKNNLHLGFTLFNAKDDTSNITGFPLSSPKKSLVVSPEIKWKVKDGIWLKLKGGYSNGNEDMYADISVNGNVFEGNIIYEGDFNNITIGLRKTSEKYLTLGNPYIHTGRTETFLTGVYELQFFYTDFDHLIYKKMRSSDSLLCRHLSCTFQIISHHFLNFNGLDMLNMEMKIFNMEQLVLNQYLGTFVYTISLVYIRTSL